MFDNGELDFNNLLSPAFGAASESDSPHNPFLYVSSYGGQAFFKNKLDIAPMEDLLVRRAMVHAVDWGTLVPAVYGRVTPYATSLISPTLPCHNPDAKGHVYDPTLAREEMATSSYGGPENLPPILMDIATKPHNITAQALKEYWKDNINLNLDLLISAPGSPRREGSQFNRASAGAWIPDAMMYVNMFTRTDSTSFLTPLSDGYPILAALADYARSLAPDDPDRCDALNAFSDEIYDKAYFMPLNFTVGVPWLVQPWLKGFKSTNNVDFQSLTTAYVVQH
jgi:ABC-type transport system substrate-binding protein